MVLYSELAAMFPHKSGGVPIYANEGWRKYTTLVGPIATFGYWIGWSVVLSYLGLFTGYIAQTAWWPHAKYGTYAFGGQTLDNGYFTIFSVHIGLQHLIAIGLTGGVGAKTVEAFDYVGALNSLVGSSLTNFFVVVICASFILSMNTATADGSRALYGISRDGLTVKELGRLNRWNVPGNAMT